ncbi:segregation/condensation protein A [Shewanella sp. SNU WT4]|uniref:segregation and condensation protein A n=1 Tax=Shewanella sp. SNU WT4 TaxID=2590015 RepID=UPI00112D393E|nr:ScpA family protein [Shewanella sp. SNU WT4]QDF67490.1 segregation/condensation protein A [Shewanella sp. SNU WT4]
MPELTVQHSLPLAIIRGEPVQEWPTDLFIPPEALEVFLEAFEGPLDLLLYLIRKHKLDVVDVSIAKITSQYLEYITLLTDSRVELAADYLVMAATLAEIKSRMLLPVIATDDNNEEEDPRTRLIKQLKAYETIKQASYDLDALPRLERDYFQATAALTAAEAEIVPPDVSLSDLIRAFSTIYRRIQMTESHHVQREHLSTRERMSQILAQLTREEFVPFTRLFQPHEGRAGVVVTFLALMELVKESLVELMQAAPLTEIYVRAS